MAVILKTCCDVIVRLTLTINELLLPKTSRHFQANARAPMVTNNTRRSNETLIRFYEANRPE